MNVQERTKKKLRNESNDGKRDNTGKKNRREEDKGRWIYSNAYITASIVC